MTGTRVCEQSSTVDVLVATAGPAKTAELIEMTFRILTQVYKPEGHGRHLANTVETGSRNMAATQKINFLTLVSYSLLKTVLARTYRFATIQNVTYGQTDDTVYQRRDR